ncbi:DUF5802 family protein [Halovenus salina]|uniref:DUF5802 family protein n=1 Tax=Halovenus salina TaxID=1510225 RepID=A0ABD5VUS9_9EURY|nr:DUF5802 family protein [Halovenus salina]
MFEQFSRGYYLGRLYVEPSNNDTVKMCREQHESVNEQLYGNDGITRLDNPLVMKLGSTHFTVRGGEEVPADTLTVPEKLLDERAVRNPPKWSEVFLAKADTAARLLDMANGQPTAESNYQ